MKLKITGGHHVAAGYYNMPEKTNEEFYDQGGKRWFKTGMCLAVTWKPSFWPKIFLLYQKKHQSLFKMNISFFIYICT